MSSYINPNQYTNGAPTPNSNGSPTVNAYETNNYFSPGTNTQYPPGSNSQSSPGMNQYFQGYPSAFTDGYQNNNPLGLGASRLNPMGVSSSTLNPVGSTAGTLSLDTTPSNSNASDTTLLARFQGLAGKLDTQVNTTADQKIDTNDLRQALDDKTDKYNTDDKQVIQAMLDNTNGIRGKLDHLDGADDGTISIDSINKMVVDPNAPATKIQTPEDKMSNTKALNVMADYMGTAYNLSKAGHRADKYVDKHGKLIAPQRGAWSTDRSKLQRMSEDTEVPEDVRTAAKKLLANKELFKTADTGQHGGDPDGTISLRDCQDAIKHNPDIDSIGVDPPITATPTAA